MSQNGTPVKWPRLAAVVTSYKKYLHPQHVVDRFLDGYGWNGTYHRPDMDVVSLYVDQHGEGDLFQERAGRHPGMKICPTIEEALTLGTGKLAVDGVVVVAEHGIYPLSENGIMMRPHYEFFEQITKVFRSSGRSVPYFNDKELSWNWDWSKKMVDVSHELNFPLQGGSSLAVTWRVPSVEFPLGATTKEALSVGYGGMTSYDFHGLETIQCMVERRKGGECGVEWLQTYRGPAFWKAYQDGVWSHALMKAALSRSATMRPGDPSFTDIFPTTEQMKAMVPDPVAYQYLHRDGLLSTMILMNGMVRDFTFAATIDGQPKPFSTQMYLPMPDGRTTLASFFSPLVWNAEQMFLTGKAQYPIERTLLTSGLLIAGVESDKKGQRLQTPNLAAVTYQPNPKSTFWRTLMLTRRRFLGNSALSSSMLACPPLLRSAFGQASSTQRPLRLAILGSTYRRGSNLQTIADRFLVGYPYEGDWHMPNVQVVSVYVDERIRRATAAPNEFQLAITGRTRRPQPPQPAPPNGGKAVPDERWEPMAPSSEEQGLTSDLSPARAQQFGFRLCHNIPEALRCGGDRIAVDAVLTVLDQCGDYPYPSNDRGQILLPRYDFFQQCAQVFEAEQHAVPYFNHKQLSFSFSEAQSMVQTSERLKFPLMSGSSMSVTWRLPDVDVPLGARVQEAVMVGVGGMDDMDFDALDAMQCMLERRKGGETGVKAVQLLEGDDVWAAGRTGRWSKDLLTSALSRSDTPLGLTILDGRNEDLVGDGALPQLVKDPAAYCIEYADGTKAALLMLNGAIRDFNIAVRLAGQDLVSTQFFMPPAPNETYSACLAAKIDEMYRTRATPYPIQRTLLTTGVLEACLNSRHRLNQKLETPHLVAGYQAPVESQYVRT